MKLNLNNNTIAIALAVFVILPGCSKVLDKQPQTNVVTVTDTTSTISATTATSVINGVYTLYKGYANGLELNVLDRITNGDVRSDNCYAGGDNPDNITIDLFTSNAVNNNISRDWNDAYAIIANTNSAIFQISRCVDPALSASRKSQMLGEASAIRAAAYFDLVRLYGRVPVMLVPPDQTSAENLIKSVLVPQSSIDTVYLAILNDLWFARSTVRNVSDLPNDKFTVSKGIVNALLAKVYAAKSPANWDSVAYYCDQTIPNYTLLTDYTFLWDNNHKNSSEAIWELNYAGYGAGDQVGNWIPSQFQGSGWKKFETPTNDLVNTFRAEGDSVRLHASITFVDYGWSGDPYWHDPGNFPVLSKYNDPNSGINDFYLMRLSDILLLRAEAYTAKGDMTNAALLVNQVRARVGLGATSATSQSDMTLAIEKERRLELAFEGHRWFDLVRTGRAIAVMNAQKDGSGNNLNYNVQAYQLLYPIPQTQLDINPQLTQNQGY
jgi:hypothetical protein